MNIESSKIKQTNESQLTMVQKNQNQDSTTNFADELKEVTKESVDKKEPTDKNESDIRKENINKLEKKPEIKNLNNTEIKTNIQENIPQKENLIFNQNEEKIKEKQATQESKLNPFGALAPKEENNKNLSDNNIDINNIENKQNENPILNDAIKDLSSIVKELNQSEENISIEIKKKESIDDNQDMINKDYNIQENKDILPQMNPNMNFSGNGQPFSSFMNQENENSKESSNSILGTTSQDLAEEAAILSTMTENIAIANKNQLFKENSVLEGNEPIKKTQIISNEEGIKKVETRTGIKLETIVKYDSVIMNQADVEVFTDLIEKNEANLNNLAPKAAEKAVVVSKTLADMLAKSMQNNQPLRIDFDNNISVIIRISRDGKISADFLPSSQVAEAYLRENLPLLRQKFDDNNLEYDSLNQRERRESNKEQNKKKDRNNE